MRNILSEIFKKRGIKGKNELDQEEKEVFESYEKILSKPEITLSDLKKFIESQIGIIEAKWKDYGNQNKAELIPYHTVYKTLLDVINSPQVERVALEEYLTQLHKL